MLKFVHKKCLFIILKIHRLGCYEGIDFEYVMCFCFENFVGSSLLLKDGHTIRSIKVD